ncbi:putative DNA-binding protein [Acinetobacter calcoaceticus]|uniref:Putative DNA-binding protein n=1 Tax=Acinetobacter calcoaceticus TaxID=471 RepID=A0A4R1XV20_ACICA|nr:putative DNA-binding protein [Acinetobacter calcoaceticus]
MDLNMYVSNKFKAFNEYLESHWQSQPYKYKEIQTLLFFQAYATIDLIQRFDINIKDAQEYPTLSYYYLRVEKYIKIPAKELFPASFHRPYDLILNEFKYLSFYQDPAEIQKKIEQIRDIHQKIALPHSSHDIYLEIHALLHSSLDFLADHQISSELKVKILYQWQDIQNLETASAYKSLEKIQIVLSNYQQQSLAEKYIQLINESENNRIEFKERTTDLLSNKKSDKWLKACFGFMNTRKGYVFIGVDDNQQIVGVEREVSEHFHNSLDRMKRGLIDKLAHESNKISNLYTVLEDIKIDGKTILVFKCNKADQPLYYKGELYMRTNGQTTRVPPELIGQFREVFYC